MVAHFEQSPFCNVFYSYKKKVSRCEKDWEESRDEGQIENNVTRALLNVLWYCCCRGDSELVSAFVKKMINVRSAAPYDFELLKSRTGIHHSYQKRLERATTKKCLLLIRPVDKPELQESEFRHAPLQQRPSIPDGWLISSNLIVAIESKTSTPIQAEQIKRHIKNHLCEDPDNFSLVKQKTWLDIYDFFKDPSRNLTHESSRFLVEQFCRYLELCGLGRFPGFTDSDFNYLAMDKDEQRDNDGLKQSLIGKMWMLAGEVLEEVKDSYKGYRDPGRDLKYKRMKDGYECVQAYFICKDLPAAIKRLPDGKQRDKKDLEFVEKKMGEQAHICVQLQDEDFAVWGRVTNGGIGRLRKKASSPEGKKKLISTLREVQRKLAPMGFSLDLYHDDEKKGYSSLLKSGECEINASTTVKTLRELIAQVSQELQNDRQDKDLTFALSRDFSKEEVIGAGSDLVREIADIMRAIHPFVQFVNSS